MLKTKKIRSKAKEKLELINPTHITTGMQDSSWCDVCLEMVLRWNWEREKYRDSKRLSVYVRPSGMKIPYFKRRSDLESYFFEGVGSRRLKDIIIERTSRIPVTEIVENIDEVVFRLDYSTKYKKKIYKTIKQLYDERKN